MSDALYPAGPGVAASQLAKASPAYRRHAWFAMLALLGFVAAYLLFSGWLAWKAYLSMRAAIYGSRDGFLLFAVGLGAGFLAVFMLKALVFVRRGQHGGLTEITATEQPRLFAFLYRLADEARAPRPARVYVSSRVNAAVFYDLSLLNFFLPSKKNLEIGLPLLNVLSVSEFKAVLAHEFGHFAQRSMAVGRWVYLAQQIAGHIVAKRDGLDRFLEGLSRTDVRIAWVGWLFSLLVWSIRSVVDTLFRLVVLADRALSREMEFQADRVSVSLAGSDALIDALYRIQSADAAWDRTLAFANQQLHKGTAVPDLYELQSAVLRKLRVIYDDPDYGVPPASAGDRAAHRIFKRDRVSVSRMWATHPASHEREENAKKVYLAAEASADPAWNLFDDAQAFRERICGQLISHIVPPPATATREAALQALHAEYDRESYKRRYRGVYLGRAVTRSQHTAEQLFDRISASEAAAALPGLYPEALSGMLERLDALRHERAALQAVRDGIARSEGSRLEHRGKAIRKRDIAGAIEEVARDIVAAERDLDDHDRRCRSTLRALAAVLGSEWEAGWLAQLRLLHYAEHTEANLVDLQAAMLNTFAMVTAKRKTSEAEAQRVLAHASALFTGMAEIAKDAPAIDAGPQALALMGSQSWAAMVGEFSFGYPTRENINEWLRASDSWVRPMVEALGALRRAALDQLLGTEARLADASGRPDAVGEAPAAPAVQGSYPTLTNGQERPRQKKLDAWSRFQTADGWWAGGARLVVAGGVIAALMGVSTTLGSATVVAYNGLDREVEVRVGGRSAVVAPGAKRHFEVEADKTIEIAARTTEGRQIESFSANPELIGMHYVYNVAAAAPLVAWTAVYGQSSAPPERKLGAPRWSAQSADALFEPPPRQITTSKGSSGGTRSVISGPDTRSASNVLTMVDGDDERKALIEVHASWDSGQSAHLLEWFAAADQHAPDSRARIVAARLASAPLEIASLREQQNQAATPADREQVCGQHRALAQAHPAQADLAYLVVRCMSDGAQKDAAFKKGAAQYPDSAWFAYAAGHAWAGEQSWAEARRAYERAGAKAPLLTTATVDDLARIRRIEQGEGASLDDLAAKSTFLQIQQMLNSGKGIPADSSAFGYLEMSRGNLEKASGIANAGTAPPVRLLVFIGASEGANQRQVAKALEASRAMTAQDFEALMPGVGLAIRHGQPVDRQLELLKYMSPEDAQRLRAFVTVLQTSKDPRQAEQAAEGLTPQYRAHAYSAGLVVLGARAPAQWRSFVKRALFPVEHPYFG